MTEMEVKMSACTMNDAQTRGVASACNLLLVSGGSSLVTADVAEPCC